MRNSLLIASAMAVALAAPAIHAKTATVAPAASAAPAKPVTPRYGSWGVDLTAGDKSVAPGDDFDAYANGAWYARTAIPADQSSTDAFYEVYNLTLDQKKFVIASQGPQTQIGALYKSFMDEKGVEKVGDKPLRADLATLAAISDKSAFARYMGATSGAFGAAIVGLNVDAGLEDSRTNVLWMGQGGIGLPDRDFYLKDDFKAQRDAYATYIARQLALAGYPNAKQAAVDIMAFETAIAKVSWAAVDRRDIDKINNPMTIAQLKTFAPGVDWDAFMAGARVNPTGTILVNEKSAVKDIVDLYAKTPLETLKAWEAFHVVDQASPYLGKAYVDSRFLYTKVLSGREQLPPRWKRADTLLDGSLGELIGQTYVTDFFSPRAKSMMEELVANLKVAMARRIAGNDWMAPATKMSALEKLARMDVMVGYPAKFRDYSALKLDPADLYGNVQRSGVFDWDYKLSDLYKPVDRQKWGMNPQEVNAYNGFNENKIVFPAGILQPPFFDPDADPAVNYGSAGVVIGHEISHGFDDQGRKVDASGSLKDWWTAEDAKRFQAEADKFAAQYDKYEAVPGMFVNGKLTLGENIADMAGLLVALDAYHASLKGKPAPVIDGLTGDQRFFLAYAQVWHAKQKPEAMRQQMASDPHTPDKFRVIGPLRNIDAWYDAFAVKPGGKYALTAADRVRIW
jgi:putative endopeptidase